MVDGDVRWTYAELGRRLAGFDAALDRLGLKGGDVVGVLGLNSAQHLVAWLGIPRSGRVICDLNYRLAPAELEFILADAGARALLVDDAFLEVGRGLFESGDAVEHLIYMGAGDAPDGCLSLAEMMDAPGRPAAAPGADSIAGIFYTGGTTGLPKGAALTHRNLTANAKHMLIASGYRDEDTYLHAAPMFHLADGASTLAVTWVGARHVTLPSFDPEAWLGAVEEERVTRSLLVPTMINMIVNHPALDSRDCSSLVTMLYGASPMPAGTLRAAMEALPCEWMQMYGMTEAAPIVTCLDAVNHRRGARGEEPYATRLRSAGCPVVGVEASVRRADGTPAGVGEPGEIQVRGENVMKGYWNRPEDTAAALDEDGWYRTGDAAYVDEDGYLYVVDRLKDMIISGGENVYSTEVENAIHQHPAVLECCVFGVPDERWGERVHAVIVLKPGAAAAEEEILARCRAAIAGYKVPRSFEFRAEALPKSGAGKVLKRDLREPHWEGRERSVS